MAGGRNCKLFVIYRPSAGVCCSCSLCMLDQKSGRGSATSICMDVCWEHGCSPRFTASANTKFLRHLNGLLLLGLTHFVRIKKNIFPRSKPAGTVVSDVWGEENLPSLVVWLADHFLRCSPKFGVPGRSQGFELAPVLFW